MFGEDISMEVYLLVIRHQDRLQANELTDDEAAIAWAEDMIENEPEVRGSKGSLFRMNAPDGGDQEVVEHF